MIKTYKEQMAIFIHINMHSSQPSFSLLGVCFCTRRARHDQKKWACYFNDSIHVHTIWGLHEAHGQICKYSVILCRLCVELLV